MLYFIPTPIGNKEDITLRSLRLFKELKFFICEDTRTTKNFFSLHEIDYRDKEFSSLTSFTDQRKIDYFQKIANEHDVAVVSDAGTPGLSDPGKILVKMCNENNVPYTVLPGATALIPAIVAMPTDTSEFLYLGFLPTKKGRQTAIKQIIASEIPVFIYESVHRVEKFFGELTEHGFTGKVFIARELSKMFEQYFFGTVDEAMQAITDKKIVVKGEFVLGLVNK